MFEEWDLAIREFQAQLRTDPDHLYHRAALGKSYLNKRLVPQAIAEFQAALRLDPQNSFVNFSLGQCYLLEGMESRG